MRYENYDSRRRHKMKVIYDFIQENPKIEFELQGKTLTPKTRDKFDELIKTKMEKDIIKFQQLERVQNQLQEQAKQDVLHVDRI